jgi:hypothetical protein
MTSILFRGCEDVDHSLLGCGPVDGYQRFGGKNHLHLQAPDTEHEGNTFF